MFVNKITWTVGLASRIRWEETAVQQQYLKRIHNTPTRKRSR